MFGTAIALVALSVASASAAPTRVHEVRVLHASSEGEASRPSTALTRELSQAAGIELRAKKTRQSGVTAYRLDRGMDFRSPELDEVLRRLLAVPGVVYAEPVLRERRGRTSSRGATAHVSEVASPTGPTTRQLMIRLVPGRAFDAAEEERLSGVVGTKLRVKRPMSGGAHVVTIERPVAYEEAERIARALERDRFINAAELDGSATAAAVEPNDPAFGSQRRYLDSASDATPGATNVVGAWEISRGSEDVTVAVLDTGIFQEFRDFAQARVLPGYDFVSKATQVGSEEAGGSADANGFDPDPSDPILGETKCDAKPRNVLHGTSVAGVIASSTNNAIDTAGVDWVGKLLPVRVLGACNQGSDGTTSDLVDALRWAAGVDISGETGVAPNPNPADVINLSLVLAASACGSILQEAVDEVVQKGVVVVAAVGNDGAVVRSPASCAGVIAVGGHQLVKNAYDARSNYGARVDVSAPWGPYFTPWLLPARQGEACPIATTRESEGTSFAAALVSGVVGLMKAVSPSLTAGEAKRALEVTARPLASCGDRAPGECGRGRVDAGAALAIVRDQGVPARTSSIRSTVAMQMPGRRLAVGGNFSCSVSGAGQVSCWGRNESGQLGDGTTTARDVPGVVDTRGAVSDIAVSSGHACVVLVDGRVECWGANGVGQLGDGSSEARTRPSLVGPGLAGPARSVAVGSFHSCALLEDGRVQCWGGPSFVGFDMPGVDCRFPDTIHPSCFARLPRKAVAISAGDFHTCAVLDSGAVMCWGSNLSGQLGSGQPGFFSFELEPKRVNLGGKAAPMIASGAGHTCVLLTDGRVRCWGDNVEGQLGDGTDEAIRPRPVTVADLSPPIIQLTAGAHHTCVVVGGDRAQVKCWGSNAERQLGSASLARSNVPVALEADCTVATDVSAGFSHTCYRDVRDVVRCWGSSVSGQLGAGSNFKTQSVRPVTVPLADVVSVDGGLEFSCGALADGSVWCWGDNAFGQLGTGDEVFSPLPRRVPLLRTAVSVATGDHHACALLSDGGVACWGRNHRGQLGDGSRVDAPLPRAIGGLGVKVRALGAGAAHTCAVLRDGDVKCWGANRSGELGLGFAGEDEPRPRRVALGPADRAAALSVEASQSCVVLDRGAALCWGALRGVTPSVPIGLESGVAAISPGIGPLETCALLVGGDVRCQGFVTMDLGGPATMLVSGGTLRPDFDFVEEFPHTCAVLTGGGVSCWGVNPSGQLGRITSGAFRDPPGMVEGLAASARAIAAGGEHSCAILEGGSLQCWGGNSSGQLGDGTTGATPFPVQVADTVRRCAGEVATFVGTESDDTIVGTSGRDVIAALGGNDLVDGRGGDDLICGGDGDDILFGGPGKDRLLGEEGDDLLDGGKGADQLDGGEGALDVCDGRGSNADTATSCEQTKRVP